MKDKRKICFVITSPIHYSRNILILEELKSRKDVDLHIVLGGSALLSRYISKFGNIENLLKNDGFENIHEVYFYLEGDKPISKAKTTGLGIVELSSVFNDIKPDLVVVRGDRFEVLSASIAANYLNIPIAHIEGGDLSGTIDESVRHAMTKLAQIHITTNAPARARVIKMGENPKYVFDFGSPDIEVVNKFSKKKIKITEKTGSGYEIDFKKPYLMVMYHPVTTELEKIRKNTLAILNAIKEIDMQTLWFWPNADTGAEEISHELRKFKDKYPKSKIRFMRYLAPKDFLSLLGNSKCLIGNSSAGIKECSYLGIPVVNIGTRQSDRLRAKNVIDVNCEEKEIINIIKKQIQIGRYKSSNLYFKKNTSKNIAKALANISLYIQKKFYE